MSGFSALIAKPDPVDTLTARAVHRAERIPAGERALREAILLDAIDLLHKGAARIARHDPTDLGMRWRVEYAEAWRWMASRDRGQPFAFELVCEALGIDAGRVRAHVLGGLPELDTPAPYLAVVQSPRAAMAEQRLSARLWRWIERQQTPWCVADASTALRAPMESVRGSVSYWLKTDRVEEVREGSGPGFSRVAGLYRVRRRAR